MCKSAPFILMCTQAKCGKTVQFVLFNMLGDRLTFTGIRLYTETLSVIFQL